MAVDSIGSRITR